MEDGVGYVHDFRLGLVCESVDSTAENRDNTGEPPDDDDDVASDCKTIPSCTEPRRN